MRLALALGARMQGRVWPNPAVGCVLVRDGRIVGRGWTQPGGRPHAEAVALAQAGAAARGATAYVSLEPCAHHGRTPPCADALVAAGVVRVVTPLEDPDPRVSGRGHRALLNAGVDVLVGVEAARARADHAGFLSRVERGRPFVTLKLALTLDGRIATASGESRWITGPEGRRHAHMLRACHDAVMVGGGTARADDPDLTVRGLGVAHQPVRVVLDSRLRLEATGRLGTTARQVPVWLCHGPRAPEGARRDWLAAGARLFDCAAGPDGSGLDAGHVLARLAAEGLTRVFCEGGGALAASLLRAGLVDEIVAVSAGKVIGADGRPGMGALGLTRLADAPLFRLQESRRLGDDMLHRWACADA
jgi:diaminohydroxyphosphoribosylaminopyrimidine deaminase/5-amino-6-(5-phosphoribosylamino)uracil reductase